MHAGSREIESHPASAGFPNACRAPILTAKHAFTGKA
jgi:hypothetical protein